MNHQPNEATQDDTASPHPQEGAQKGDTVPVPGEVPVIHPVLVPGDENKPESGG